METTLNITTTNTAEKKSTKSLKNVNPKTTNAQLKQTAQLFAAIGNTTYTSADRINKINVEESDGGDSSKTEGTISYNEDTSAIHYNGDAQIYMIQNDGTNTKINNNHELGLINDVQIVYAPANNNFTAAVLIVPHEE